MFLKKLDSYKIILASASPRRAQLLKEMGLDFEVRPKHAEENVPKGLNPVEVAEYLSKFKADAFSKNEIKDNCILITADTVVALKNEILGKPENREDAVRILQKLSGKSHDVITGVTLKSATNQSTFSVKTEVFFKDLNGEEIAFYVDKYKPYDKAGAYGIQEWIGHVAIDKIEGSYFNVMGMPTHRLYEELNNFIN